MCVPLCPSVQISVPLWLMFAHERLHHRDTKFHRVAQRFLGFLNEPCERFRLRSIQDSLFNSSEGGFRFMPEVGDMAPDFELKSNLEKDKKVKLSDFRGKKNVVIAFYPLAWTPV